MSHKAFYQTFFQTEQLFRRTDDVLAFPAIDVVMAVESVTEAEPVEQFVVNILPDEPISLPTVAIVDPIIPIVAELTLEPVAERQLVNPVSDPSTVDTSVHTSETVTQPVIHEPEIRRPASPLISQKVLILVDEDLHPSDLLFLEKVLKAVHLDVDGVDLLNVHGTKNINFAELLAGKYIHHFFTFGVPFSRLNLDIMMDQYHPVRFEGITFLMADSLPTIEADVALKKKLWESLKKVFLWR